MEGKKESLEERLERIRLKNELIETRHREAEEDRIRALKNNAMVEVKSPKHEDWPTQHKYDILDFTYDVVDPESDTASTAPATTPTAAAAAVAGGRKKKTFEDGDGPPPDPAYNFLADSERDGTEGRSSERKRIGQEPQSSAFRKTGSFRRQNSSHSNSSGSGGAGPAGSNSNNNSQKGKREGGGFKCSPPTGEYKKPIQFDQQPKKNLETNWRTQSRDIDKATTTNTGQFGAAAAASPLPLHSNGGDGQMDDKNPAPIHHQFNSNLPTMRPIVGCSSHNQPVAVPTTTITTSPTVVRQPLPIVRPPPALQTEDQKEVSKELVVEQRGNIQISVSKDGEIQSVKLTSARAAVPGSGRVGLPRAITKQSQPPPSPAQIPSQQQLAAVSNIPAMMTTPPAVPAEAQNPNQFHIQQSMAQPPPQLMKVDTKKFSVQDRLAKFQVPT